MNKKRLMAAGLAVIMTASMVSDMQLNLTESSITRNY